MNILYKMFSYKDSCILWWNGVRSNRYSSMRTNLLPSYPEQCTIFSALMTEAANLSSPLLSSPLFSEDSNLHHIAMTTWGRIKFNFFRNNPNRIFSFPKRPGQPWGPDRLLCYINWGRFSRRSSNQKREAGYSPPPSIALPSPTCLHGVYTDNVSDQSVEAYK